MPTQDDTITLEVMRDLIRTKSVLGDTLLEDGQWNYFLEENPRIGFVRITTFGEFSAEELEEVLPFQGPSDRRIDPRLARQRGRPADSRRSDLRHVHR